MKQEAEDHLYAVKKACERRMDEKYRRGQEEHGGDLRERNVGRDVLDEMIDGVVYAVTLLEQHNRIYKSAEYIEEKLREMMIKYEMKHEDLNSMMIACQDIKKFTK